MTIYLVCDISGSTLEDEERLSMRGMARAVEQYYRFGYGDGEIKLVAWNNEARFVQWNLDDEFPQEMLDCKNAVDAEALIKLLGSQPDGKIIIITDGFWGKAEKAIKRWKDKLLPDTIRIIKIGADANPRFKGAAIFTPDSFLALFNGWLERDIA